MTTQKRKPIGTRNGLNIFSTLKNRTKLKSNGVKLKRKPINKVSKSQAELNKLWSKITDEKFIQVGENCLWCGKSGKRKDTYNPINGHHIIRRRRNNYTIENCYPCHDLCHSFITDHNINVSKYPTKLDWEKRNTNIYEVLTDETASRQTEFNSKRI